VRQQRWLHADSCEGLIDRPNIYEQGWGKKLNYAIGATVDSVADVTKRYTRKFFMDEFQARRREWAPEENTSDGVFRQMNAALRQMNKIGKGRLEELDKRGKAEEKFFGMVQSSGVWDVEYREGRISGSLAWKSARNELGDGQSKKEGEEGKDSEKEDSQTFLIESFYPSSGNSELTIVVQPPTISSIPSPAPKAYPECIIVCGVPCAVGTTNGISTVIIDEASGCILQSKAFSQWSSAGSFLDSVPDGRIVAICCLREGKEFSIDDSTSRILGRLGGFNINAATSLAERFFSFVGQLNYHPKWSTNLGTSDSQQLIKVSIQLNITSPPNARLRSEANAVPATVSTRLPESIMPLKTQLAASDYQKRVAFNAYMGKDTKNTSVIGYTTRQEAPVYLIDNTSFPFRQADGHTKNPSTNDTSWATYHFLPDLLVPDDDDIKEEAKSASNSSTIPKFDIPIADDYFTGLLGNQLLVKNAGSSPTLTETSAALANTRLVALYFSASWCGPCRGFTPLLIEFYNVLKEVAPSHGLELIFVSSDRDEMSFQQYYAKMPFLAHPFSNRAMAQQIKSIFGVRGIPSLVVIDSLSGRIVVSPDESRREVHQACQRGEDAIEALFQSWLEKVPAESQSMLEILALSFQEAEAGSGDAENTPNENTKAQDYLVRKKEPEKANKPSTADSAARVKEIFAELVGKGMAPNTAAAEAIKQATAEQKNPGPSARLEEGDVQGTCENSTVEMGIVAVEAVAEKICQLNGGDKDKLGKVLSTAKKYVANVQKDPYNPRFRNFRLSNKVFDTITSTPGSIELLTKLGFVVFHSDMDFVASIPLSVDLSLMGDVFDNLLKAYSS